MAEKTAGHWNIRSVLAMLYFALMGLTALLEIFGVFREVGTRLPRSTPMTATCPKHPTSSSAARPARAGWAVAS